MTNVAIGTNRVGHWSFGHWSFHLRCALVSAGDDGILNKACRITAGVPGKKPGGRIASEGLPAYREEIVRTLMVDAVMALEYDFENSVGCWLLMASHDYQQAINEELAPQGVTFRQCQVLGVLALSGPSSQADLAQRMGIEPPTLVGILDRMERDGWIRRAACADDRRRKLVQATKNAEPVWSKMTAAARRVRARATKGLTAAQLAQLKELLELVRQNLKAPTSVSEAG